MSDIPQFPGVRRPLSDFGAVKTDLQTQLRVYVVDLSTARSFAAGTQLELTFPGNSIYIDKAPDVGNAFMLFQDDTAQQPLPRLYVEPGFIARTPWTRLTVENSAQPGKVLRILYGVDVDFVPGTSAGVQITGVVDVDLQPQTYGVSYASSVVLAAATPVTVLAPASNLNGVVVHSASIQGYSAAFSLGAFLAKSSAPAGVADGVVICGGSGAMLSWNGANGLFTASRDRDLFLPAGLGIYAYNIALESVGFRSMLYTVI